MSRMLVSFLSALIPQWIALDGGYTRWAKRDLNVGADFGDQPTGIGRSHVWGHGRL